MDQPGLTKPTDCTGCPLEHGEGFMLPSLSSSSTGVMLIGEALGEDEAKQGQPFVGRAGFKLTRLLEWAGFARTDFDIINAVWCRPPQNKLEGTPYEMGAIAHCRSHHWDHLLQRARVLVPMGNVPLGALTGRKGILSTRGYVRQTSGLGQYILPTVHPSFIQRGQAKYSAAFIADIQKAVQLAREGYPTQVFNYVLDPSPREAYRWAEEYHRALANDPTIRLAYDIETPYKDEDETAGDPDLEADEQILRIGFSYRGYSALSVPWDGSYLSTIELLLSSSGDKVVWNGGFDNPRIRAKGVKINGLIHDGMVAWHVLHSDLPKGLGFVATFTCPWQQEWKHLNSSRPAYYNATDADVELRSMEAIERELRATGLWSVYDNDVLMLEPILAFMSEQGMPTDSAIRLSHAQKLHEDQQQTLRDLQGAVPPEARKIAHIYKKTPKDTSGLVQITVVDDVKRCSLCGLENPPKAHFKLRKKNPSMCEDAQVKVTQEEVVRYAREQPFKPSREQLIRYQQVMGRPVPTTFDHKLKTRKLSMNEKALKELMKKYPDDPVYPLVLTYRELDKLAGTYIGRPEDDQVSGEGQA